jgi:hypothetical protein
MKVKLYGEGETLELLHTRVKNCLEELGLVDFIELEVTSDSSLKEEM